MAFITRCFCDVCGKEIEPYEYVHEIGTCDIMRNFTYHDKSFEALGHELYGQDYPMLCDDCYKKIVNFVFGEKEEENEQT